MDKLPKRIKGTVHELLSKVDERGLLEKPPVRWALTTCSSGPFSNSLEENSSAWPFAATILRDVDVYFFDEPSSYLDIHERMRIVRIIQELAETKRVIVIEHDLAVLDVWPI